MTGTVLQWTGMRMLAVCLVSFAALTIATTVRAQDYWRPPLSPDGQPYYPQSPALPPPGYAPPAGPPYQAGEPRPVGYRLVNEPIRGLVISGYITTGIAYGLGLMAAIAANFENSSAYMVVPIAGPWLTLGRRHRCTLSSSEGESYRCVGDFFVVLGLITDGVMQTIGGSLLLSGYLAGRTRSVRSDLAWSVGPRRVGSGYGLAASAAF
jgi:hypothetical protein